MSEGSSSHSKKRRQALPVHVTQGSATLPDERTRWALHEQPFALEQGGCLDCVRVAYRTWGTLNAARDNAVVVCHAFAGSADIDSWWPGMLGPKRALDPERDFIVCSNVLGGCNGTTGACSLRPHLGLRYGPDLPLITVRDMVKLQIWLAHELGIARVRMVIGGSLGGMQALEWAIMAPELVESVVVIAASGRQSAWCMALQETQRAAIEADPAWKGGKYPPERPPGSGLALARMMALCSQRGRMSFERRLGAGAQDSQAAAVASYLKDRAGKFAARFDANTYIGLTRALDSHDLARGRADARSVLGRIRARTLIVSITTDVLYPVEEQAALASAIPNARLAQLRSVHGHDAWLIELDALCELVAAFRARASHASASAPAPRAASMAVIPTKRKSHRAAVH